jgi:hypothetical protein
MGQEIVYCFKCQIRLLGSDFEKGKAFRVGSHVACLACMKALLADDPDPEGELERRKRSQMAKGQDAPASSSLLSRVPGIGSRSSSTARIPLVNPPSGSTARIPAQPASVQTDSSSNRLLWILGGLAVLVILIVVMAIPRDSSDSRTVRRDEPRRSADPTPPPILPSPPVRATPTPALQLEELDARLLVHRRAKAYDALAKALADARARSTDPDYQRGIDDRLRALDTETAELAAPLAERAATAWRRGDDAAVDGLRRQVEAIGTTSAKDTLARALGAARDDPWVVLSLRDLVSANGATLTARADGSVLAGGKNPDHDSYTASAEGGIRGVRAFRLEAMSDPELPSGGPGRVDHGNFVLGEFRVLNGERPLPFTGVSTDFEQDQYPASAIIDGNPLTGWAIGGAYGRTSTAWLHLAAPVDLDRMKFVLSCESKWYRHVLGCFRISVSRVELPPPPAARPCAIAAPDATPAAALDVSPDLKLWTGSWNMAARRIMRHDFSGAAKEIEKASAVTDPALKAAAARDLADLRTAAELEAELPKLLPRWVKGAKVKVDFIGPGLFPERVEGVVIESTPKGVSLQLADGVLDIPAGELGSEAAAALVALRGEKRPGDARALEVFAAADGRPGPSLSENFKKYPGAIGTAETEARALYWRAEEAYASARTRPRSAADYTDLLSRADKVAFVARNRPFLEGRVQGAAENVFFADDVSAGGAFTPVSTAKGELYWHSQADAPPGKWSSFIDAEVLVPASGTLRAWVYGGGCCQEVFTVALQGTGLSGPSIKNPKDTVTAPPGGEEAIAVKPPALGLKKKHSDHTGAKIADHWGWIDLGVLKFAEPGVQKIRVLTDQKGFAFANLVVGSARQAPPRETELRDLTKARPVQELRATGTILRELWRNIQGGSVAELRSNPRFQEGKPDESGPITYIDSWNMGDNYGCRIRGYVHPPVTGAYTFWVASDDEGELWLSADDTPAKKQKICHCPHAVGQRAWDTEASQKSAPVTLAAGKRYYIEVLQKQGWGPEHVAAGWQLPDGTMERAIPPSRLSPVAAFPPRKSARPTLSFAPLGGGVEKAPWLGGQTGGNPFEDCPEPRQFLRGIRYAVSGSGCIRNLQPLYIGPSGAHEGRRVGDLIEPVADLLAKPGYAVGGMTAKATERFNSFKLLFMKISGNRLDPADSYESPWVGGQNGGPEVRQGGDGRPAVGLHGRAGAEIDSAALIFAGK